MKRDERDMLVEIHTVVNQIKIDVEDHETRIRNGERIDNILGALWIAVAGIGSWIFTRGGH